MNQCEYFYCGFLSHQIKFLEIEWKLIVTDKNVLVFENNKYFVIFCSEGTMCQLIAWSFRNDIFIKTLIGGAFLCAAHNIRFLIHFYHEIASCITTAKNGLVYVTLNLIEIHTCTPCTRKSGWKNLETLGIRLDYDTNYEYLLFDVIVCWDNYVGRVICKQKIVNIQVNKNFLLLKLWRLIGKFSLILTYWLPCWQILTHYPMLLPESKAQNS